MIGELFVMKKYISLVLCVITALSCCFLFSFAGSTGNEFTVTVGSEAQSADSLQAVKWFKAENGEYFFFIPSYWNTSALTVWVSAPAQINGKDVESGTEIDLGKSGTVKSGAETYKYNVITSSGVGTVFIATESGSLESVHADKSHKEAGEISIKNAGGKEQTESTALDYIKGRGNASWNGDKKPYNIKLGKKAKILGMAKSKKWCLIANEGDRSLMRNTIVFNAAADAGLDYTPECAPVDLYINGEYLGSYLLTSKIEADGNRIDVEDLDEINEEICLAEYGEDFDMDTIAQGGTYGRFSGLLEGTNKYAAIPDGEGSTTDGGYVLEMEIANRYPDEKSGFVTKTGQPFIMKSPEFASKEQIEFISGYYQRFEDAAFAESGKNSEGESYGELIDVESFAKYYDISEWTSNMDTGLTSTYFYLDTTKDGRLYAGPVWDYDIAFGNSGGRFGLDYKSPKMFTVCHSRQYRNTVFGTYDADEKPGIFNVLCKKQDFTDACRAQWDESVYEAVSAWSGEKFDEYAAMIKDSAVMNHIRRGTYGTADIEQVEQKYSADVAALKNYASTRAEFLNGNLGKIQEAPVKTAFPLTLFKAILTGINNLFEKFIVRFHLENK